MKQIIQSAKVGLKGYQVQSLKSSSKTINGRKTITKLTMPVSFIKGDVNPIKLKKQPTGMQMLKKAYKKS